MYRRIFFGEIIPSFSSHFDADEYDEYEYDLDNRSNGQLETYIDQFIDDSLYMFPA